MELKYFTGDTLPKVLPVFYYDKRQRILPKVKLTKPFQPSKVVKIEFRKLAKCGYNIWLKDGSQFNNLHLYDLLVEKRVEKSQQLV